MAKAKKEPTSPSEFGLSRFRATFSGKTVLNSRIDVDVDSDRAQAWGPIYTIFDYVEYIFRFTYSVGGNPLCKRLMDHLSSTLAQMVVRTEALKRETVPSTQTENAFSGHILAELTGLDWHLCDGEHVHRKNGRIVHVLFNGSVFVSFAKPFVDSDMLREAAVCRDKVQRAVDKHMAKYPGKYVL